ncbi:MAG: nucleotidyltransferase family protein [Oscillospiraceae bacterium]|nr:nucleotidyltransferase family protein [Oscillospiraceae bacterium]MDD4367710.1 nucleotidyltransferase family protein [Oscillospiraceae bacterium]
MTAKPAAAAAAIISCAGLSSRMGRFKPLLPLSGHPVLWHTLQTAKSADLWPLILVTGYRNQDIGLMLKHEELAADLDQVLNPQYEHTDMLKSYQIGLARLLSLDPACEQAFFWPADVPLVKRETLLTLIRTAPEADAVIPSVDGRGGHPPLFRKAQFPAILKLKSADGGLRALRRQAGFTTAYAVVQDPGCLLDADTEADYQQLQAYSQKLAAEEAGPHAADS